MKVLILNPILYTSETDHIPKVSSIKDTMIYTLCMGFVKNGDEPVLVAADCYRPEKAEEYPFQILWFSCILTAVCKPRCLPLLKGLRKYLRHHKNEYDYIISSEVFSLVTLEGVIHAKEKLIIWHELGAHNNFLRKLPSKLWYYIIAKRFYKEIPVIPRSEKAADFIVQFCNHVLPVYIDHSVDLEKIYYSRHKENYFVVVSQLIERKHIDEIIMRFTDFRKRVDKNFRLKIIGDGELRSALEKQVKDLDEEDNIIFLGKLNHEKLIPVLAKATATLINTSKDNSMVSIVESIAAGTPIITTPVPFNASYIKKESLGIVKKDWNFETLEEVCNMNQIYVDNCIKYREKLSNVWAAKQFNQTGGSLQQL